MELAWICFSKRGEKIGLSISEKFSQHNIQGFYKSKYGTPEEAVNVVKDSLSQWTKEIFSKTDGIIFIGATGIAVRSIAPVIDKKQEDPAVIVIDEAGQFCISLLSGHLGGGNQLAEELASIINAIPVITTATDRQGVFAVDNFAKKNNLAITSMEKAKEVSARLLNGEEIYFSSELPFDKEELPIGLVAEYTGQETMGIHIGYKKSEEKTLDILELVPKGICLGIGCRKGTSIEKIENIINQIFTEYKYQQDGIAEVASIDLKKDEAGIIQYCNRKKVPFIIYSKEELLKVEGEFSTSEFVESITGVDNVCERSALCGKENNILKIRKQKNDGVTLALSIEEWRVRFE